MMARLDAFLQLGREQGCSDIHLAVGTPPMLRMYGELVPVKYRDLGAEELESMVTEILTEAQWAEFNAGADLDFSYTREGMGRFRVNLFQTIDGIGASFRVIATEVPSLDALGLPTVVKELLQFHQGLVLVTGATGTGKSTTLAAMIDYLNSNRKLNIITLEDPIEYIHPSKISLVVQREVGTHVGSFAEGLRAALREDPDVILVGEMRDTETISLALTAAETGHLVLGTLHTTCATKTLERIIDAAPAEQKAQVTVSLAQSLHGVVSQTLVKKADSRGRKAILEIMVMTPAIVHLLSNGKIFQIPMKLETGRALGMQLTDQALFEALQNKEIDPDDAYLHAHDKKQFQRFVTDPNLLPKASRIGR
jgi:twitching motility protein PilT